MLCWRKTPFCRGEQDLLSSSAARAFPRLLRALAGSAQQAEEHGAVPGTPENMLDIHGGEEKGRKGPAPAATLGGSWGCIYPLRV